MQRVRGRSATEATAFARVNAAEFCRVYKFPKQMGFSFHKYGTIDNANRLAREAARRGHFFCSEWFIDGHSPDFAFGPERMPPEDPEFVCWMAALPEESACFQKAVEILALEPINP